LTAAARRRLFISSVQKELQAERRAVKDFVQGDALLKRYFEVFLFEDLPAVDRKNDDVYLEEVERSEVYVGLFANEYGNEDREGLSPTEREFQHATAKRKTRLIFVKGIDDKARHPKMLKLIRRAGSQLIRRRFNGIPDLNAALYASLVEHLERSGKLRTLPFDASACPRATLGGHLSRPSEDVSCHGAPGAQLRLIRKNPARKGIGPFEPSGRQTPIACRGPSFLR
jgi:hypothetical protein